MNRPVHEFQRRRVEGTAHVDDIDARFLGGLVGAGDDSGEQGSQKDDATHEFEVRRRSRRSGWRRILN
jgi:hypothetical protein